MPRNSGALLLVAILIALIVAESPARVVTPVVAEAPSTIAPPAIAAAPTPQAATRYWGVSLNGVPWDMNRLAKWEDSVAGKRPSIIHYWQFWKQDPKQGLLPFSAELLDRVRAHGAIPMISWTSERMGGGANQVAFRLGKIIGGSYDSYIRQWATEAKAWGHPFFLRWGHEMNSNTFAWSEDANGNQRGQFVQAWRHIHDIFTAVGASNVSWVWCPNIEPSKSTWPAFASLYPGDNYVDWTCLDGYNWSTTRQSSWMTFSDLFAHSYEQITQLAPSKPLMIGEWGSAEQGAPAGASKAAWIADALGNQIPHNFPRIKAQVWYNLQFDGVDWRLESSQSAAEAWRAAISSPTYLDNQFSALSASPIPIP